MSEPVRPTELHAMALACELASRGAGTALPNPVVGCVVVSPSGEVVGEGFHERAGGPHAEVVALAAAGDRARGATAVVTLEPCNHTGRTGPCSEALIAAGVSRVVVAVCDPWAPAAGGMARLRAAGVSVVDLSESVRDQCEAAPPEAGDGPLAGSWPSTAAARSAPVVGSSLRPGAPTVADVVAIARDVNRVWLGASAHRRPFVTVKLALSLDGRVAAPDGTSRWISSPQSRAEVHALRRQIDCIAVGIGTVLADDPHLTSRSADGTVTGRQPLRVVLDSRGRTPPTSRVLDDLAPTLLATVDRFGAGPAGGVDLRAVLGHLYREGRRHLMVEGGPRLAAAFLDSDLVDEVVVYLAPLLLGAGRAALEGGSLTTLAQARRAELVQVRRVGPDVALRYRLPVH